METVDLPRHRFHQPQQVALRRRHVGKMHAPARNEEAAQAHFAANPVGPFGAGGHVGADLEIAALAFVDAAARCKALGQQGATA